MPDAVVSTGVTSIPPPDFRASYAWYAGAIPRSWSYSIVITADGRGEIQLTPADGRAWKEGFTVHPFHLGWLYALTLEHKVLAEPWPVARDHRIGGASESLAIRAGGHEVTIPPDVVEDRDHAARKLREAVRSLVPAAFWERLGPGR